METGTNTLQQTGLIRLMMSYLQYTARHKTFSLLTVTERTLTATKVAQLETTIADRFLCIRLNLLFATFAESGLTFVFSNSYS